LLLTPNAASTNMSISLPSHASAYLFMGESPASEPQVPEVAGRIASGRDKGRETFWIGEASACV
jgi:hypothetical protein